MSAAREGCCGREQLVTRRTNNQPLCSSPHHAGMFEYSIRPKFYATLD